MLESILLGGGCFWCTEAVFQRVTGVEKVVSGYAGGSSDNPTYEQVCSGTTGHAEVVEVTFNPDQIKLAEILDIFFHLHNPTTLNQQGADKGTQYRSVIFYSFEKQKQIAEYVRNQAQVDFLDPIVTEITPLSVFYPAEDYHQNYFNQHSTQGYCQVVINPKVAKLKEKYFAKVKE
jgi:methionine-S-sulfoxide reductase